jgi:hypothetical protein
VSREDDSVHEPIRPSRRGRHPPHRRAGGHLRRAGPRGRSHAASQTVSTQTQPLPTSQFPDGRYFGYIRSVGLHGSPPSIVFDEAQLLEGEAANRASAAHGDEVPVPNDIYVVDDDPTVRALTVSDDAEFLLLGPGYACCEGHPTDRDQLTNARAGRAWGYWITLRAAEVVEIEEQWHP